MASLCPQLNADAKGKLEPLTVGIVACGDNQRLGRLCNERQIFIFLQEFADKHMAQYVFSMNHLTKTVPPKRQMTPP